MAAALGVYMMIMLIRIRRRTAVQRCPINAIVECSTRQTGSQSASQPAVSIGEYRRVQTSILTPYITKLLGGVCRSGSRAEDAGELYGNPRGRRRRASTRRRALRLRFSLSLSLSWCLQIYTKSVHGTISTCAAKRVDRVCDACRRTLVECAACWLIARLAGGSPAHEGQIVGG